MTEFDQLDGLLARWVTRHRLTSAEVAWVRSQVFATAPVGLDADRLWSLLWPVTALVDRLDREPASTAPRWPTGLGQHWTTYLQLA